MKRIAIEQHGKFLAQFIQVEKRAEVRIILLD